MKLIRPESIPEIDAAWMKNASLSEEALIRKAGDAVAKIVLELPIKGSVLILAGGGNNGADGYAVALSLHEAGVDARVIDVFGRGQRSAGGKAVLAAYCAALGDPLDEASLKNDTDAAILVEAVMGSGASGQLSEEAAAVAAWLARQKGYKLAVDVPLGVDADLGEIREGAFPFDMTVVLSLPKRGLLSYPAKEYCGRLVYADLGIDANAFSTYFAGEALDADFVKAHLPVRTPNSHKGSFGRLHIFAGSKKYRGASCLASLGAARMGVGLLTLTTEEAVIRTLGRRVPELLFDEAAPVSLWRAAEIEKKCEESATADAVLVGPGLGVSEPLYAFVSRLATREGAPLLLDADALGAIAAYAPSVDDFFASSVRPVLLTPHPLEFGRLIEKTAKEVQEKRMRFAIEYAKKWGVSLLLKGAGTLITDGDTLYINTTGSSALAKGGSGDVLAGAVGAFLAAGVAPTDALALGAYLHGAAGDSLASELSMYGVLPSELPRRMARLICSL